ncbi:hypothetical protein BD770DRAFT_449788 [Pilaira anomala]|nr:hypothetical protein BD770DRAFT_449788 [Pilaira anomala]
MFAASHLNNLNRVINQLYVGSIVFFFETSFEGVTNFVVLIDVVETQGVVNYDKYLPKVALRRSGMHKYVVCRFDDIACNVGLVRFNQTNTRYKLFDLLPKLFTANNQSAIVLANVTGAGRRTRGAERVEEGRSRGDSAGDSEGNTSTDIRTLINNTITQSNQNMKDNIELYHRLAEARLDRISAILNEQRRLDREERENYFRNRNNSPR